MICGTCSCVVLSVAEAVKGGVEKAGGNATIYQYVHDLLLSFDVRILINTCPVELQRHSRQKSLPKCMLRRNLHILSSLPLT